MTIGSSLVRLQSLEDDDERVANRIAELQSILSYTSTSIVQRSKAKVELATLQKKDVNLQRRASIQKLGGSGIVKNRRESSEDQSQSTAAATTNDDNDDDSTIEQQPNTNNNNNNNKRIQLNNKKYRRTSLQNLQTSGLVTKNTALLNAREAERLKQQQLIKELHDMLHNNANKKLSAAKRLELEEQLRVAEERLVEVMDRDDVDNEHMMGDNNGGSGRASSVPDSYGYGGSTMDTSYDEQGGNGDAGLGGVGATSGEDDELLRPVQRKTSIETMEQEDEEDEEEHRDRIKVLEGRVNKLSIELKQQEKEDALVQSVAKSLLDSHNKGRDLDGLDSTSMNGAEEVVHVIPRTDEEDGVRSQYNLEEQLHLAQEAITAIEALDNDRVEEVELINHMLGEQEKNNEERMRQLETLVLNLENAMLQHNQGERGLTLQLTNILGERIKALDKHVANLVGEADDEDQEDEKTLAFYKAKSERLEIKCFSLEGDLEECDITIAELKEWKKLQEERIAALEQELKNKPPSTAPAPRRPTLEKGKSRRLSSCAALDPNFSAQLKRASKSGTDINQQMKEEAEINMKALEAALKDMDGERSELLKELETMKALIAAANGEKPGKKVERLVYQLSCRKCNKHKNFVGTTHTDLPQTMKRHFKAVYEATKSKRKSDDWTVDSAESSKLKSNEAWSGEFAAHFAKHCKPTLKFKALSEKDVIKFCRENIKVEVLKRGDGAELYWEDDE